MVSLGPLLGTTPNFGFNLVNFDWVAWHDYDRENWTVIDALLAAFIGINNVSGQWANNTSYLVGQRVVDGDDGTIWEVLVAHTSAVAGTFVADRTANPGFWQTISPYTPIYKGIWANNTIYSKSDFVSDPNRYFIANTTHTSNAAGTVDNDIANWDTLIDLTAWSANLANTNALVNANILDIATNTGNIATNTGNIGTNTINIATNVTDIATNATNIGAITSDSNANIISKAVDYPILPADLVGYDSLIILVDASLATRNITYPAPADYLGKTILIIADVDPAGNSVITKLSGGTERHTSYAKGDFIKGISDGVNDNLLDEKVTIEGKIAKTAYMAIPGSTTLNPFNADIAVISNVGGLFDAVTNFRLETTASYKVEINYGIVTSYVYVYPSPNHNGTNIFIPSNSSATGIFVIDMLAGEYIAPDVIDPTATAGNFYGNVNKKESFFSWRVLGRIR